jgi:hypothetical protein
LSLQDQSLLEEYPSKLNEVDDRIRRNADTLDQIVFKGELSGLGPKLPSDHDALVDLSAPTSVELAERQTGEVFVRSCAYLTFPRFLSQKKTNEINSNPREYFLLNQSTSLELVP